MDIGTSDLLHDPDGAALRHLIHEEDRAALTGTAHPVYANSRNVASRLETYLGLSARPLYHPPPLAERLVQGDTGDYLFAPGRINPSKRLDLILKVPGQHSVVTPSGDRGHCGEPGISGTASQTLA